MNTSTNHNFHSTNLRHSIGRKVVAILLCVCLALGMVGCSQANHVNHNMSVAAGQFKCLRKITVYNALSDTIILEAEGYMDISNNSANELIVTCKVGEDSYKKNYIYLNSFTMYTVEDVSGSVTDPYHYRMIFHVSAPFTSEIQR